jgi:AcrR family transcriptional regulator
MKSSTRARLVDSASQLFAAHGYRGASVRDICNLAGANPGAVSYHFGGKHQLYRVVLRQAASNLANLGPKPEDGAEEPIPIGVLDAVRHILTLIEDDENAASLLLRDLADGGLVAVESLAPPLRAAYDSLVTTLGPGDDLPNSSHAKTLFLELAAPVFLLTAAWPIIARALGLENDRRRTILEDMVTRTLAAHGLSDLR